MKFAEMICSSNLTWKLYFTYKFKTLKSLFTHGRHTSFPRVLDSHQKRTARSLVNREHRGIFGPRSNSSYLRTYIRVCTRTKSPGCVRVIYRWHERGCKVGKSISGKDERDGKTREEVRSKTLIKQKIFSRLECKELEYVASSLSRRERKMIATYIILPS